MIPAKATRYVLFGQLSLYAFLGVCLVLMPHFLLERDEGGISNYGTYLSTVLPYSLALGLCGLCMVRAASLIRPNTSILRVLRRFLIVVAIAFLLVLISTYPYKKNLLFTDVHVGISMFLLAIELLAGFWFARTLARNVGNSILLFAQVVGSLLTLTSATGPFHILLAAQLLTNVAFGALMIRAMTTARHS